MSVSFRVTPQEALTQATELQQRIQEASDRIGKLTPEQQIREIQSETMQVEEANLIDLTQNVQSAVLNHPGFTITGLNTEQLTAIQEKLTNAASLIEGLQNDNALALELVEVTEKVQALTVQRNPNPTEAASLLNRVQTASSSHGFNNEGANEAVKALESALKAMTQPAQNGNRQASRQTQPAQTLPRAPAAPSYNQNGALEKERQLKQAQDEDFKCSQFKDQFKDIQKNLTSDPIKNFDIVLPHYNKVQGYVINLRVFRSDNACRDFGRMRDQLETMLEKYINEQAAKEAPAPAPQVQAQPQGQTTPLHILQKALEDFIKTTDTKYIKNIQSAYESLNINDKNKLFDAVNDIRKAGNIAALPGAYKKMNLHQWAGASTDKLKAVEKLLAGASSPAQPAAPATPPAPKKADEMRKRFIEVKNMLPKPVAQPNRNNSSLSGLGLSPEEYAMINGDTVVGQVARQDYREVAHPHVATMQRMQQCLKLITPQMSDYNLGRVVNDLNSMVTEEKKFFFKMSSIEQQLLIGDRPFFHLYLIHKNETPEKLKDDMAYGGKAFAGVYPETTHEERARCVSRAIVELALENIEGAINYDNGELLVSSLDILEAIKLNEKDRAEGNENVAHHLFGAFYHAHVAARIEDGSLVDPSDSKFQNDFGRHAFRGSFDGVDPANKLQAIAQVRNALKAAWKL